MPVINKPKKTKEYDNQRKERMKLYNSKLWKELRETKRKENPLCFICELEGRTKICDDLHHLISPFNFQNQILKDFYGYNPDNVINLCDECHNSIHHGKYKGCITKEDIIKRYEYLKDKEK